ncbi:hypothetical protein [Candidatus Hodarchaeum mangrovi]
MLIENSPSKFLTANFWKNLLSSAIRIEWTRMVNLLLFERILRNKEEFYTALIEEKGIVAIIRDATLSIVIFGAFYGATMGVWSWEPFQIVFSALKIPILFLISIAVVLPSYYVVNLAMGGRNSFLQLTSLILYSLSIYTTILLAFVPVNLFFMITSPRDVDSYTFMVLLNLLIYGLGGLMTTVFMVEGVKFQRRTKEKMLTLKDLIPIIIALGTLAFIGTQMAWFIRPWFNYEPNFIRPEVYGNFYVAILKIIFTRFYIGSIFVFLGTIIMIPFIIWISRILLSIPITSSGESARKLKSEGNNKKTQL